MILSLYGKGEGDKGGGRREGLGKGGGEAVADYSPRKNLQYKLFFIGPASDFSGCGTGHARIPAMLHAG